MPRGSIWALILGISASRPAAAPRPVPAFPRRRPSGRRGSRGAPGVDALRVAAAGALNIVGLVFANLAGYAVGVAGVADLFARIATAGRDGLIVAIAAFAVLTSGVLSALAVRHLEAQAKATRE